MFGISRLGTGYSYYQSPYAAIYGAGRAHRTAAAAKGTVSTAVIPAAQPETPVQPAAPVPPVDAVQLNRDEMLRRWENDPAAMAARERIQYIGDEQPDQSVSASGIPQSVQQEALPGAEGVNEPGSVQFGRSRGTADAENSAQGTALPGFAQTEQDKLPGGKVKAPGQKEDGDEIKLPGQKEEDDKEFKLPGQKDDEKAVDGKESKSAQEVMEESECQTCKNRKYQDGSDDPGVSFKSPTHIDPDMAPSQVRGHEMEHVVRERASAQREDRKVVSQSVTYHTAICPECGRVYVSGGTTRTTTSGQAEAASQQQDQEEKEQESPLGIPSAA